MTASLRFWLVSSFGAILLICLVAVFLVISALNHSKELEDYHANLKTTRILLLETNKLKESIFLEAYNDSTFYTSTESQKEKKFNFLRNETTAYLTSIENSEITSNFKLEAQIAQVKKEFQSFNFSFNELIYLLKLKGFKDYGLEGKMRDYAHLLFDFPDKDLQFLVLQLRRHEKDFLLRKDLTYSKEFQAVTKTLLDYIQNSKSISTINKNFLVNCLYHYSKNFEQLAKIESIIGLKGLNGYYDQAKSSFEKIASKIELLDNQVKAIEEKHKAKLQKETIVLMIILVGFLITTIILLTNSITKSVRYISQSFTTYVNSGFNHESISYKRSNIKEFNSISISFTKMAHEIHIFTNFFREKVHERTLALNEQNVEILAQRQQIADQYNALLQKNEELNIQKQLVDLKNSDIQDSLRYAQRIQSALQPNNFKLKESFEDCFVFSQAKDVVSGDFHLIYQTNHEQGFSEERTIFVAADCTGHGVPGAMMSVLGINTIHKIINELKITNPAEILARLDKNLNSILIHGKSETSLIADGMDIAIFSFCKQSYELQYCVAKFPHLLLRGSEVIALKSQKASIGYSYFENETKAFTTETIKLNAGDRLYLFSDGLQDQFGGPLNKKFKKSNVLNLTKSLSTIPMNDQKDVFKIQLSTWKKELQQTDDVLVMGIRF